MQKSFKTKCKSAGFKNIFWILKSLLTSAINLGQGCPHFFVFGSTFSAWRQIAADMKVKVKRARRLQAI